MANTWKPTPKRRQPGLMGDSRRAAAAAEEVTSWRDGHVADWRGHQAAISPCHNAAEGARLMRAFVLVRLV